MLIEKFIVPASELTDVGLQEIKMNKLGHFVVLVGKNGAGKTRILDKLIWCTKERNEYTKYSVSIIDANATVFGKPLTDSGLSDGQKVLIQFAVALHAQKGRLDNTVFIMVEPENHLHPSALIEFFDALGEVANNSQFWIATHSVPLLAYLAHKEPMSIWYVEDGKVSNAGKKPEQVLSGLLELGNEEQIGNLNAFTSLPAQYAAIRFAAECLLKPLVSEKRRRDPQVA
jgi:ABC-type cobalamin/Fe3+-siderophores transport system ATPase subunit